MSIPQPPAGSAPRIPSARPGRSDWRRPILVLVLLGLVGIAGWQGWVHYSTGSHLRQGRAALRRDDPEEARHQIESCLAVWPQDREANFLAARAARRCGDLDAARKYLKQADALGQALADLEVERALIKAQAGYPAEVEAALLKALEEGYGESAEIVSVLLPVYLAEYRIPEAEALAAKWVELRPDTVKAWAARADVLERLHNKKEAVAAFRRLVELAPDDRRARFNLARLLLESRQAPDEAAGHLERLTEAEPGDGATVILLAACREAQGRTEEAVALLDRVIAGPACDAKALHHRGRLELNRGQPAAALAFLRRAIELDPSDSELLYTHFLCVQQIGTPAEARAAEERWRRCDTDLKRVGELGRTIATSPKDPDLRREMGELFLRNGRTVEGIRWLESALRIDPRHAPTHRVLAAHYEKTGRPDLARTHGALAAGVPPP